MRLRYRVIKNETVNEVKRPGEIVWVGDLGDLNQKFPRSEIFGADDLGHHEIDGGLVRWDSSFEKSEDDGKTWVVCRDPRRVRGPHELTELEREIDAENRARFPGDYDSNDPDDDLGDYDDEDPDGDDGLDDAPPSDHDFWTLEDKDWFF